jgi:hypothetical protein
VPACTVRCATTADGTVAFGSVALTMPLAGGASSAAGADVSAAATAGFALVVPLLPRLFFCLAAVAATVSAAVALARSALQRASSALCFSTTALRSVISADCCDQQAQLKRGSSSTDFAALASKSTTSIRSDDSERELVLVRTELTAARETIAARRRRGAAAAALAAAARVAGNAELHKGRHHFAAARRRHLHGLGGDERHGEQLDGGLALRRVLLQAGGQKVGKRRAHGLWRDAVDDRLHDLGAQQAGVRHAAVEHLDLRDANHEQRAVAVAGVLLLLLLLLDLRERVADARRQVDKKVYPDSRKKHEEG